MNKRLSNASKTSKHWDCWFVSELVSCLSLTNSPQRHLVDPDFASCRSDSCSCIGQKKISGSLLQRPMVLVECIHFIVTLIAPIFSGTKILKLQFHRGVYSTLRFSNVQQTNSVHLVFTGWGCKWLTKVLEWCFYFFFFSPIFSVFILGSLGAVAACMSSMKLSSVASLVRCRNVEEAAWWRCLEAEPAAFSHTTSAEEPNSSFVHCFLPSLSLFCFC